KGIRLVGPVRPLPGWQAKQHAGYAAADLTFDWQAKEATCRQGASSVQWTERTDGTGQAVVAVRFATQTCLQCPVRAQCTRSAKMGRQVTVRSQAEHEALQHARRYQQTPAFRQEYARRAGVEGTISQAVRAFGLRQGGYVGLSKTEWKDR